MIIFCIFGGIFIGAVIMYVLIRLALMGAIGRGLNL